MDVGELLEVMRERLVSRPFLFGAIVLCFGHSITTYLWRYWGGTGNFSVKQKNFFMEKVILQ